MEYYSNKKERIADKGNNMDEFQKRFARWKKPDTEASYCVIYLTFGKGRTIGSSI